jgi:hypothetical protein
MRQENTVVSSVRLGPKSDCSGMAQKQLYKVEVKVTLRLTVSQSVCFGVEPTLGLATRYYLLSEGCCLVSMATLSDERTGLQFAMQSHNGYSTMKMGAVNSLETSKHFYQTTLRHIP